MGSEKVQASGCLLKNCKDLLTVVMHVREREESGIFSLRTESLSLLIILRWEVCEWVYEGRETKSSHLDMCGVSCISLPVSGWLGRWVCKYRVQKRDLGWIQ